MRSQKLAREAEIYFKGKVAYNDADNDVKRNKLEAC